MLDAAIIEQLLALLPESQSSALLALGMQEDVPDECWETAIQEVLESLDWEAQRDQIGALVSQILPLESLVPGVYRAWRPIVRDAVAYVGTHLSLERLLPKLVEQMLLPDDVPLEQRVMLLIARMPSLQKIGQIVARNQNLDLALRAELTRLENSIRDIEPDEIRAQLEHQLGQQFTTYSVEILDMNLVEASVSAVIRFTWLNPAMDQRERGVFKVLKPYVGEYFSEELELLQGLAEFFDANRRNYGLARARLRETFDDVRHLLAQEINFRQEQANLLAASQRYANVASVRIPRLIPELSTATITATTEEAGVKVTEAFAASARKRGQVAARLIEALLAVPLFAQDEEAIFHADPHAGNLFVDEQTGELIIFDWALTERLNREERRQIILLMLAVALRDGRLIFDAVATMSQEDVIGDQAQAAMVRDRVADFIKHLSLCTAPGPRDVLVLLNTLFYAGIRFSPSLVVARKVLFTLDGVLHDVAPGIQIGPILARYVLTQGKTSWGRLLPLFAPPVNFHFPLSSFDWIVLYCSALFFGSRMWLQIAEQVKDRIRRELRVAAPG